MYCVVSADGQRTKNNCAVVRIQEQLCSMRSLEDVLLSVWRQTLIDESASVKIEDATYPVKSTPRRGLKQVDFRFNGKNLRGLEQNPDTKSRWTAVARAGKKVMQFLDGGRYLAVVADGKVHLYSKSAGDS